MKKLHLLILILNLILTISAFAYTKQTLNANWFKVELQRQHNDNWVLTIGLFIAPERFNELQFHAVIKSDNINSDVTVLPLDKYNYAIPIGNLKTFGNGEIEARIKGKFSTGEEFDTPLKVFRFKSKSNETKNAAQNNSQSSPTDTAQASAESGHEEKSKSETEHQNEPTEHSAETSDTLAASAANTDTKTGDAKTDTKTGDKKTNMSSLIRLLISNFIIGVVIFLLWKFKIFSKIKNYLYPSVDDMT